MHTVFAAVGKITYENILKLLDDGLSKYKLMCKNNNFFCGDSMSVMPSQQKGVVHGCFQSDILGWSVVL